MLDGISLPVICAANHGSCAKWFVHLKSLMNHPILKDDEKLLWLWLATCSANNQSITCSLSYEQISLAVNKPERAVHRILFRLKVMGLLLGDIPIWYGVPTPEMVRQVRKIKLVLMEREFVEVDPASPRGFLLRKGFAGLDAGQALISKELRLMIYKPHFKQLKPKRQWVRGVVNFVSVYATASERFRRWSKSVVMH